VTETASSTFKTSILTSPSTTLFRLTDAGNLVADPRLCVYYLSISLSLKLWKRLESTTRILSFAFPLYCRMNARYITQGFFSLSSASFLHSPGIILRQHPSNTSAGVQLNQTCVTQNPCPIRSHLSNRLYLAFRPQAARFCWTARQLPHIALVKGFSLVQHRVWPGVS
jgi:hypothetical protein